jgi:translation initiation factor 2 beta subunit (eIF-2beta)/eIF-5
MEFNMNGNNTDTDYRYKIPMFKVNIAGQGNGIYTIFTNIDAISKKINHPIEVILKYIASATGSNYIQSRNTITGSHNPDELKDLILFYIKHLVMCPTCGIPETMPQIDGAKKNTVVNLYCTACHNTTQAKPTNKHIAKAIDIIIKYLKAGGEWKMTKGTSGTIKKIDALTAKYAQTTDTINPFASADSPDAINESDDIDIDNI